MKTFICTSLLAAICMTTTVARNEEQLVSMRSGSLAEIPRVEKYYAIFLAHQSHDNTIEMSHTFAVFLRTQGDGPSRKIIETATISWLPVSGQISVVRPAEPGVNKSLADTLAWAEERNLEISMIGPFEIDKTFYGRAVEQVGRLERGEFKYRCHVARMRTSAKNCVAAVADIFPEEEQVYVGIQRGLDATLAVVENYRPKFKSVDLNGTDWAPMMADLRLSGIRNVDLETAAAE